VDDPGRSELNKPGHREELSAALSRHIADDREGSRERGVIQWMIQVDRSGETGGSARLGPIVTTSVPS
jgi:hypothetical protein